MTFNIYVSNAQDTKNYRINSFDGLSLGEVRSFLYDLCKRDIKKNNYLFTKSNVITSKINTLTQAPSANGLGTSAITKIDVAKMNDVIEKVIYDYMSAHEIMTTVWNFSDKTAIVVKVA